jgi:hypothetical protein
MATATLSHTGSSPRTVAPRTDRPSAFGRLWAALSKSRPKSRSKSRRREEAEIAGYIETRGGRITDALERDIERRFLFGRF